MEHPSGSIELEPLEETRFELGSCLDLNAKPVRTDEFGRQLGNRAAGPRHGVHSQLLPSKKRADMAQRGPVVGRRRREQSERFAVAGGPCGQTQFDDAVGDALGCRVAYALAQLADARTAAA